MSDIKDGNKSDADPELDDLLDSALEDMTKKQTDNKENNPDNTNDAADMMWNEETIKQAAAQFESNMAAILGSFSGVPEGEITQEQIAQTFTKMAEAAAHVMKSSSPVQPAECGGAEPDDSAAKAKIDEVSAAISQTLQSLNTNSENLQTPFSDQDLAQIFNNLNTGEEGQEGNMFVPFMQGMMQSLLSKEVLYPSLKELLDKYPSWLEENKGKIDQKEYDRFSNQQDLMKQICTELEPEQESDSEDVKRKRFEKVLELMQRMQDLGQPPTELVGDIAVPPQGFAAPPGQDPSQCNVM